MRKPILEFISGDALGLAIVRPGAIGGHSPNVPTTRPVRVDIDPLAVRRVVGTIIIDRTRSKLLFTSAGRNTKDIEVVATLAYKSQPFSIRRPAVEITRMIFRNQDRRCAIGKSDEHPRFLR